MRIATHYGQRRASARSERDLALIAYQEAVARIGRLPADQQDSEYAALARLLDNHTIGRHLTRVA